MNDLLITILGGGLGVAIFQGIFKLIEWRLNRKAKIEDRAYEKETEDISKKIDEIAGFHKESYKVLSNCTYQLELAVAEMKEEYQREREEFLASMKKTDDLYRVYEEGHAEVLKAIEDTNIKVDTHISTSEILHENIVKSNKLIMREKIRRLALDALERGYIYVDEHSLLHAMWNEYHDSWKGNGDLNIYMSKVDKLPIKDNHD